MATIDLERRAEIGRQKRERTRVALIKAAMRVVAQQGFDAPTIDDFIAAAAVARGTFYNYFDTKEALLGAMAAYVADTVDAEILPLIEGVDDPAVRVATAIRHFIRFSKRDPDWGWILVRSLPDTSGGWSEGMRKGALGDIQLGKRTGRFRVDSVPAAVALGIGTLAAAIRTVLVERTTAAFGDQVAVMTLQAFGIERDEAIRIATLPLPPMRERAGQAD
jgi:AcrR family transcriptional regulator